MMEKLKEANADDAQARESARTAIARWAGKMARGGAEEEKIEAVEVACALNTRGEPEHGQVARMLKTLYEATPPARVRDLSVAAITSCIDCATLGTRRLGDIAALHARHDGTKLAVMNDLVEEALDAPVAARLVQHALRYPSAPALADAAKAAQVLSGVPGQSTRMADAVLRYATGYNRGAPNEQNAKACERAMKALADNASAAARERAREVLDETLGKMWPDTIAHRACVRARKTLGEEQKREQGNEGEEPKRAGQGEAASALGRTFRPAARTGQTRGARAPASARER